MRGLAGYLEQATEEFEEAVADAGLAFYKKTGLIPDGFHLSYEFKDDNFVKLEKVKTHVRSYKKAK